MQIARYVKYEAELDPEFAEQIASVPGGEALNRCIQCGTCSAACPLSIYMDYTPRRIIAMTKAGFKDEVLHSTTIWLCSSCYACTVRCPKEIKITDLMYALKRRAIEEGAYSRRFPIPALAKQFFGMVRNAGRTTESRLVVHLYRNNPVKLLRMAPVGFKLFRTGRLGLRKESIKAAGERKKIGAMLDAVERTQETRS
ncbi:MAG: 4Fe-4S dicluster domain-containing protein [Candidatus Bipolaricaulia bacterium]